MKKLFIVFLLMPFFCSGQGIIKFKSFDFGNFNGIEVNAVIQSDFEYGIVQQRYIEFRINYPSSICTTILDYSKIDNFYNILKKFSIAMVSGLEKNETLQYLENDEILLSFTPDDMGYGTYVFFTIIDGIDRCKKALNTSNVEGLLNAIAAGKVQLEASNN